MKRKYKISAPKFFEGQRVYFNNHNGRAALTGEINYVETNYGRNDIAYHVYAILPAGWKRHLWVGEKNIINELYK